MTSNQKICHSHSVAFSISLYPCVITQFPPHPEYQRIFGFPVLLVPLVMVWYSYGTIWWSTQPISHHLYINNYFFCSVSCSLGRFQNRIFCAVIYQNLGKTITQVPMLSSDLLKKIWPICSFPQPTLTILDMLRYFCWPLASIYSIFPSDNCNN